MTHTKGVCKEPYMKYYSPEEIRAMCLRGAELLAEGREEAADRLFNEVPLLPKSAKIMKEMVGVDEMIASGVNLYEAVKEYGPEWLRR